MKIDRIYIACYKYDHYLTRICVASIRYWYSDIPIYLIKDRSKGDFSTAAMEKHWNVQVLPLERKHFGWSISKLEVLFLEHPHKALVLDSDIIFLGPVIDELNKYDEAFIVSSYNVASDAAIVRKNYFDLNGVRQYDPSYQFPGRVFNGGQMVFTSAQLAREDFKDFIEYADPPKLIFKDVFKCAEQGFLNYLFEKWSKAGRISVKWHRFHTWIGGKKATHFDLAKIRQKEGYTEVMHFAGEQFPIAWMHRRDLLSFYQKHYYSAWKYGAWRRRWANFRHLLVFPFQNWKMLLILLREKLGSRRG